MRIFLITLISFLIGALSSYVWTNPGETSNLLIESFTEFSRQTPKSAHETHEDEGEHEEHDHDEPETEHQDEDHDDHDEPETEPQDEDHDDLAQPA